MNHLDADDVIASALAELNEALSKSFSADILFLKADMQPPLDDELRLLIEGISSDKDSQGKLVVIVETTGGYIEVVERIVKIFRKHYPIVEFVVPNYAYSAGTILVLSGDEIHMDYHSILGPIDPQYKSENGTYLSGMGYLAKYEELRKTINKATDLKEVRAETAYLVQKFDPAQLFNIEQAREHAKSLLRNWLPKYKFKDWNLTETKKTPVTNAMKEDRANEIAEVLGDANRWHSHGRGITVTELTSEDIKLKVKDFGADKRLNEQIRNYYSLTVDYSGKKDWPGVIHSRHGLRRAR